MIQLYNKGQTEFSKKGITINAQTATVNFQDNGRFDMELTMPMPDNIEFDYGMIIRCSVPEQHIPAITLGTVSYYEVSNRDGSTIWSVIPTLKKVSYKQWVGQSQTEGIHVYNVGDKVTYLRNNYKCTNFDASSPQAAVPPNNSSWWERISNTTGSAGKAAAEVEAGDVIMKTADFNSEYMEAATLNGKTGYIKKSDVRSTGNTETRTIPAQNITAQNFTITEIEKSSDGKQITLRAEHVSYGLGRTMLGDCNLVNVNPATAVLFLQGAMKEEYGGEIYTNLPAEISITANWSWKNAQNAILDPKAGLLQYTAGQMIRNDMNVFLISKGEATPKYTVKYGTNLTAVKFDGSVGNIVTRIYPTAQTADGNTLLLPEEHIDTVRTVPFIRPEVLNTGLKVGQKETQSDGTEIELTEAIIYTRMRTAAYNRFNIDECDKIDIQMEVDWIHLPDTEEYKPYAALQNAAPGEWVRVKNGPLGIDEIIQLTGYTFDPILERYKKATFGKNKVSPGVASHDIQTGAISGRALAAGAVGGQNIQAGSITAREIEAGSITADQIASRSITAEIIAANAITAEAINAGSVTAEKIAAYAITAEKIAAYAITSEKIAAGSITVDRINAGELEAEIARITDAEIATADIGFAQIKALTAENLIAHDAITDRYYIRKLAVDNAQFVYATVGELIVKATNNRYYRLDIDANGALSPTDVTTTLSNGEITAGMTSDGHSTIIETDLAVTDLSASNAKAINALIDKITASRINVDELFARQAFISKLNTTDIRGNQYLQIMVEHFPNTYMQWDDPSLTNVIEEGDIWYQTAPPDTNAEMSEYTNAQLEEYTHGGIEGSTQFIWKDGEWVEYFDPSTLRVSVAEIRIGLDRIGISVSNNAGAISQMRIDLDSIELSVRDKYGKVSGIEITSSGIEVSGSKYIKIKSGGTFVVDSGNFSIDASGNVSMTGTITAGAGSTIGGWSLGANRISSGSSTGYVAMDSDTTGTYAIWAGHETAGSAPFRVKRDGSVYITSLWTVGEDQTETEVNLRTAGLWKLSYQTIKQATIVTDSNGKCTAFTLSNGTTVNFSNAASVDFASESLWISGTKTLTLTNGKTHNVNIPTPADNQWTANWIGDRNVSVTVNVGGKALTHHFVG